MSEKKIGRITHFFGKISVAVVELTGSLKKGDTIRVKGIRTDFEQDIGSMQIDHKPVAEGKSGQSIGLMVIEPVREGDIVFRVTG